MLPDPYDPDTEDRRPDRDRELVHEETDREPYGYDDDPFLEDVSDDGDDFFEDRDLVELSADDLRDMEGPDA